MDQPSLARFLAKVKKVEIITDPDWTRGPCWIWQGATTEKGYGRFCVGHGKTMLAHRASYAHYIGKLVYGYIVDHECSNKGCVNPDHLTQVGNVENLRLASERRPWKRRNQYSH